MAFRALTLRQSLWRRANTRNVSLWTLYGGQFTFSTRSVDNTKLPCYSLLTLLLFRSLNLLRWLFFFCLSFRRSQGYLYNSDSSHPQWQIKILSSARFIIDIIFTPLKFSWEYNPTKEEKKRDLYLWEINKNNQFFFRYIINPKVFGSISHGNSEFFSLSLAVTRQWITFL